MPDATKPENRAASPTDAGGPTSNGDPFDWVGSTLQGKYRIDSVIGDGGFGVVYRAQHAGFAGPVAIKCLKVPPGLTAPQRDILVQTLLSEGRLLHTLSRATADVVQALDIGEATSPNGTWTPFLVLEWLDGITLGQDFEAREVDAARLSANTRSIGRSLAEAIGLLTPAARALAVAHELGITHRDVKPSNLFLAEIVGRRTMKVLDFGLAKALATTAAAANITLEAMEKTNGVSAFTPRYAAPEQYSPRYGDTGPWTDVYSLAMVFVEAVTGHPALRSDRTEQLYLETTDLLRRPTLRNARIDVADAVEMVMLRALAVDPRRRYPNASDFWNALVQATTEMPKAKAQTLSFWKRHTRKDDDTTLPATVAAPILAHSIALAAPSPGIAAGLQGARGPHRPAHATGSFTALGTPGPGGPTVTGNWLLQATPEPKRVTSSLAPSSLSLVPPRADYAEVALTEKDVPLGARGPSRITRKVVTATVAIAMAAVLSVATFRLWPSSTDAVAFDTSESLPSIRESAAAQSRVEHVQRDDMLRVSPAMFIMGHDSSDDSADDGEVLANSAPEHPVRITKAYLLDRREVTVDEYERCVAAGACSARSAHPRGASTMCRTTAEAGGASVANCVTRDQAMSYCTFVGKRLPTEAEWEHAARDGDDMGFATFLDGTSGVREWVSDGWEPFTEDEAVDPLPWRGRKPDVLRGDSWDRRAGFTRVVQRASEDPSHGDPLTGFRCAKNVVDNDAPSQ